MQKGQKVFNLIAGFTIFSAPLLVGDEISWVNIQIILTYQIDLVLIVYNLNLKLDLPGQCIPNK